MARARNIKPGFFTNDELVELPFATRLLFIGLWTIADREGRVVDRPKKIKMEIFPADDVDCEQALGQLADSGFITRYQADGIKVIEIANFAKHQAPHSTEKDSVLPDAEGFYTVNERSKNGGITGKSAKAKAGETKSNVKPPLDNVIPPSDNALIPDSPILNPDTPTTTDASAPVAGGGDPADQDDFVPPDAAPLPPANPALALTLVLRPLGVNVMSTNPIVIGWADRGVSVELLAEAVRIAREHKGDASIPPQYLAPIVERLLSPVERRTAPRPPAVNEKFNFSHLDRSGDQRAMEESMQRHGITTPGPDEEIEFCKPN
jgi:hypothetical protein